MIQELIRHCRANIPILENKIYQPYTVNPDEQEDFYMVISPNQGEDITPGAYINRLNCYIYDEPGDFSRIEEATDQLIKALALDVPYNDTFEQGFVDYKVTMISDFYLDQTLNKITNGPIRFEARTRRN